MSRKVIIIGAVIILSLTTLFVLVYGLLTVGIIGAYHPNAKEGSYGMAYIELFALAMFLNWLYALYVAFRGKPEKKLRNVGVSYALFVLLIVSFYVAYTIPRDYRAEYYIGQEKYSIPWQYDPINGSKQPGGKYFVIEVNYPEFSGVYASKDSSRETLGLAKYAFDEKQKSGASLDDVEERCAVNVCASFSPGSNAYFVSDGYIYHVYTSNTTFVLRSRGELAKFKNSVVELFDSFKVN